MPQLLLLPASSVLGPDAVRCAQAPSQQLPRPSPTAPMVARCCSLSRRSVVLDQATLPTPAACLWGMTVGVQPARAGPAGPRDTQNPKQHAGPLAWPAGCIAEAACRAQVLIDAATLAGIKPHLVQLVRAQQEQSSLARLARLARRALRPGCALAGSTRCMQACTWDAAVPSRRLQCLQPAAWGAGQGCCGNSAVGEGCMAPCLLQPVACIGGAGTTGRAALTLADCSTGQIQCCSW